MNRKIIILLGVAIVILSSWISADNAYAVGITVTVNGSGDLSDLSPGDGKCDVLPILGNQCSFRAAIEELNALGSDSTPHRIEFNIGGSGPFTIPLASQLPNIIVPLVIDGETQPGASCPTNEETANLQIVLDGTDAGTDASGLIFDVGSEGSTVRGLAIGNFDKAAIHLLSDGNTVHCNHLGIDVDGFSYLGNDYGVLIESDNNQIGGDSSPAERNVISRNQPRAGVYISSGTNNSVRGNFIGTTADGQGDQSNTTGIYIGGNNNIIGGTNPLATNIIAGNSVGIQVIDSNDNIIYGNYIGVAQDGITPLPHFSNGIRIWGSSTGTIVGGTAEGEANTIAYNGGNGVAVEASFSSSPTQNTIRGNIIFGNEGLGIDLGNDGVDTNDPDDNDNDENERQNYPILVIEPGSSIIDITLNSAPNTVYQIDIYLNDSCNPSGFGEGEQKLVRPFLQTDDQGQLQFQLSSSGSSGRYFTATATDPEGNTSEFSACALMEDEPTPTPTNTATSTTILTATPTLTVSPTPTTVQTVTATATKGSSLTPTTTATNESTPTSTPTATVRSTVTSTISVTQDPLLTPTMTSTPTQTPTLTISHTPTRPPDDFLTQTPDPPQVNEFFIYLPLMTR